jgi:hypothetical protein
MSEARALLAQRCSNHETREAVCRCPECRRSLCRECVTEHAGRLVCAQCLRRSARDGATPRRRRRKAAEAAAALAGLLLAWTIYFAAGESLVTITERSERVAWQDR